MGLSREPGTQVSRGITPRYERKGPQIADMEKAFFFFFFNRRKQGETSLEKLVLSFLVLSGRAGQEGAALSRAWRSCFQLREGILKLSILAKPDGSRGPQPPQPTHVPHTWTSALPVCKLPPFSAWLSSLHFPSPVM